MVNRRLRALISKRAAYRCGYCQTPEKILGAPLELDHIIPQSLGGQTEEENLWLSCAPSNRYKGARIIVVDPVTGERVRLFNPVQQSWEAHFRWSGDGMRIIGTTEIGRATVLALKLNRATLVQARVLWREAGWHPADSS